MDNMKIWNKVNRPPNNALSKIAGGRLKGKSDINPQWRYEIMTEVFGVCGVGWKYDIVEHWIEDGFEGVCVQFVKIHLFVAVENGWSDPIPGVGGKEFVAKEYAGLHTNEESLKMAVTDALGTAMKMLGVAADVYKGLWDGSKYVDSPSNAPQTTQASRSTGEIQNDEDIIAVDKIMQKPGETNGKPWTRYTITDVLGVEYITFSKTFATLAKDSIEGSFECVVKYSVNKFGQKDLKSLIKKEPDQ